MSALNDSWPKGYDPLKVVVLDASPVIEIVQVAHPIEVWTKVHGWIEQAFDNDWALLGPTDIFNELARGHILLWAVSRDDALVGCFVTKVEHGSRGKGLNLVAVGGRDMESWIEQLDDSITKYAREQGCRFIAEMGRKGWVRVFGNLGWSPGPVTMIKVL